MPGGIMMTCKLLCYFFCNNNESGLEIKKCPFLLYFMVIFPTIETQGPEKYSVFAKWKCYNFQVKHRCCG